MSTSETDEQRGTITTDMAARLLMVSKARIGQLEKMEYFQKIAKNRWNLAAVVQGYIKFLKDEERRSSKSAGASRIQSIRGDRLEMEMAEKRRQLVPVEDVRVVLDSAAGLMRSEMMAVPARFTRDVADRKRLDGIIATAMNKVADGMDEKAAAIQTGEDVD